MLYDSNNNLLIYECYMNLYMENVHTICPNSPFLCSDSLYRIEQDFLDIQYLANTHFYQIKLFYLYTIYNAHAQGI